jgi:hypothetical protein
MLLSAARRYARPMIGNGHPVSDFLRKERWTNAKAEGAVPWTRKRALVLHEFVDQVRSTRSPRLRAGAYGSSPLNEIVEGVEVRSGPKRHQKQGAPAQDGGSAVVVLTAPSVVWHLEVPIQKPDQRMAETSLRFPVGYRLIMSCGACRSCRARRSAAASIQANVPQFCSASSLSM